ncbi:hypothetical protein [Catellatospora chokoriensis]|uniref:Uncharacterized protein n=1 Tax=Catellatospora chokoriensis TaxID=310353 RepID=A0A8J3K0C7_9ACTN|nr:hypothetical protein [Catellatospora chokoriensis]GIF94367.1 hypothetical protein Cch02nite_78110 [Catellatospora chokoriensis]
MTPGWVVSLVPALATLCAAVITGIAAASLKHRWDVAADVRRKQWEEADARRRERVDALTAYLLARPALAGLLQQRRQSRPGTVIDLDSTLNTFRAAYARVLIVLPDEADRQVVDADYAAVKAWLSAVADEISDGTPASEAPMSDAVIALARDVHARSAVGT